VESDRTAAHRSGHRTIGRLYLRLRVRVVSSAQRRTSSGNVVNNRQDRRTTAGVPVSSPTGPTPDHRSQSVPIVRATGDPEMDAQVSPHTCPISVAPLSGAFRNSTENGPRHTPVQGCQRWERSATFCGYRGRFIGRVLAIKVNRAKFPQPPRGFEPGPTHYEIVWPRKQARAPSRIMPRETSGSTRPR